MEAIFVLIPVSLIIVSTILWAFVWSVGSGQFEDLEKEASSILFEDETPKQHQNDTKKNRKGELP